VHEIHRHAAVDKLAQRLLDAGVIGVRVVVAHPGLEEITEDVQRIRFPGFRVQEIKKLLADLGALALEVQVGNKECSHISRKQSGTFS
jgi:hypothetical protein